MTTVEIIGVILGSNVALEIAKNFLQRKQTTAGTIKLRNEAGQIVLEGELKVTEFYKEQLEAIMAKYLSLEKKFEEKIGVNELGQTIARISSRYCDIGEDIGESGSISQSRCQGSARMLRTHHFVNANSHAFNFICCTHTAYEIQ